MNELTGLQKKKKKMGRSEWKVFCRRHIKYRSKSNMKDFIDKLQTLWESGGRYLLVLANIFNSLVAERFF